MSDDEDDFAFYGTAVEQYDEDNFATKKAPRLEDQTVTDKQGRRRFHGAFTGGFSAGHFNTVGSVEGFTPSTFTSSRTERNKEKLTQNIEMFMDEEDLSAHGIAAQRLQPSADFGGGSSKRKRVMPGTGPIPGTPVLLDLVIGTSESVGVRLLRKLGWREGQGVGPRLSHAQKKRSRNRRQLPTEKTRELSDSDSELPAQYSDTTFAPDDYSASSLAALERKDNTFGLGYKPLSRDSILGDKERHESAPFSLTEKKKTMTIKGQAFGVGAFEEEDDDIYAQEDMSYYNFTLGGTGDQADTANNGDAARTSRPSVGTVCELLEGFVLSAQATRPAPGPPLPQLPANYVPQHRPLRKRFSGNEAVQRGLGRHDLGPDDRRRMRDAPAASVEVRTGVKGQEPPPPSPSTSLPPLPSELFSEEESGASPAQGYQPFASDADKQKRYNLYLRMRDKGLKSRYSEVQPACLTEWERHREIQEFERAAQLYKPLTSAMATRFVSSSLCEGTPLLKDGLNMNIKRAKPLVDISKASALGDSSRTAGPDLEPSSDPRMQAARTSMFGRLTLDVQRWHPDGLLCRRFNVPPPYPDSRRVGVVSDAGSMDRPRASGQPPPISPTDYTSGAAQRDGSRSQRRAASDDGANETRTQVDETPETYGLKVPVTGPPTMDLFKAIFEDSSSSDSESDSDSEGSRSKPQQDSARSPSNSVGVPEGKIHPQEAQKKDQLPTGRVRKSRFEPRPEEAEADSGPGDRNAQISNADETVASDLPKHVFVSQKTKPTQEQTEGSGGKLNGKSKKRSVMKSSLSFMVESDQSDEDCSKEFPKRGKDSQSSTHLTSPRNGKHQPSSNINAKNGKNKKVTHVPSLAMHSSADPPCDSTSPVFKEENPKHHEFSRTDDKPNASALRYSPGKVFALPAGPSELPKPIQLSQSRATGIFADIDFTELNKYRELMTDSSTETAVSKTESTPTTACRPVQTLAATSSSQTVRRVLKSESEASENSSVDSEEEYGAALPPNFVNPLQVIRGAQPNKVNAQVSDERLSEKCKSPSDSKHRMKKKKSEKKKKHKKKSHKESKKTSKHKKKKRYRSDSSSGSSSD